MQALSHPDALLGAATTARDVGYKYLLWSLRQVAAYFQPKEQGSYKPRQEHGAPTSYAHFLPDLASTVSLWPHPVDQSTGSGAIINSGVPNSMAQKALIDSMTAKQLGVVEGWVSYGRYRLQSS
jgi:hypothetical protein